MLNDKRRATRRPMRYTAWIGLDTGKLVGCAFADVSDTGCRLDVEDAANLPEQFVLLLSRRGYPKRNCRVVWRTENQLGVTFDRNLPEQEMVKGGAKPALTETIPTVADAPPAAPQEPVEKIDVEADQA